MKRIMRSLFGVLCLSGAALGGEITTASLLDDMTNLDELAEFPSPAYTCKMFSSYDRRSTSPADTNMTSPTEGCCFGVSMPTWFANGDCNNFLRVEDKNGRKEYVMMDAQGPGAIVRMFTAAPEGTVRIYLDGGEKPVIESPMADLLGGKFPHLPRPIAGEYARGWNLYIPIPYAKSCKVTTDKVIGGMLFYHINYRTYPADTKVVSFSTNELAAIELRLKNLAATLAAPRDHEALPAGAETHAFDVSLAPAASATLGSFRDSSFIRFGDASSIRRFRLQWTPTSDRDEKALRAVVLEMTFDGETTVRAPLGDFFGTGPGVNPYDSLPLRVANDGSMTSRWVMPFKKSAEVRVVNLGPGAVALKGEIVTAPYAFGKTTMLFHAKWRIEHGVPTEPKRDWNYLTAKGKGVFVGAAFAIDNPVVEWWGEGDEKIYVDGETFPSDFGTGTEDYYGLAWCKTTLFEHAYHNQTRCDGSGNWRGNSGRTSLNRFHIFDRIPFAKDFRFDMELWHQNAGCKVNASVITYWYAAPGATDGFQPITADDVTLRENPGKRLPATPAIKGAIEGESLHVIENAGTVEAQEWPDSLPDLTMASGCRYLWWRGNYKYQGGWSPFLKPGDALVLGFNNKDAGTFRVFGRFVKAKNYGIAQMAINDTKAGDPIDFYNDGVILTSEIELGVFDLKAGENRLTITIAGANEKAEKLYMVGLDYVRLEPAKGAQ